MSREDAWSAQVRAVRWRELGQACRDGEAGRDFARVETALDELASLEPPPVAAEARSAGVRAALGRTGAAPRRVPRAAAFGLAGALAAAAVALWLVRARPPGDGAVADVLSGSLRARGAGVQRARP